MSKIRMITYLAKSHSTSPGGGPETTKPKKVQNDQDASFVSTSETAVASLPLKSLRINDASKCGREKEQKWPPKWSAWVI